MDRTNLGNECNCTKIPTNQILFTSRPYVFDQFIGYAKVINIGNSSDVPTYKLFSSYTKAYNITINAIESDLLKYALTTPLALKLFCDLNKNKTIEYYDRADISIATLLQKKINVLEKEFCSRIGTDLENNQYVLKTIRLLATAFNVEPRLEKSALTKSVMGEFSLERTQAELLIKYLEDYGVLRAFCEHRSEYLPTNTYYFYPGIQGYFDYASALILLDEYKYPQDIDFEKYIQKNALYALTIISIQSFDYLLTSNATIGIVADPWFKQELDFIALRH